MFHSLYYERCKKARQHFKALSVKMKDDIGFGAVDCHRKPEQGCKFRYFLQTDKITRRLLLVREVWGSNPAHVANDSLPQSCEDTNFFVKVPRPGDSEVTISVFESSCHQVLRRTPCRPISTLTLLSTEHQTGKLSIPNFSILFQLGQGIES